MCYPLPMNTGSVLQLDPAACHDPRPTSELCLLAVVVQMALRDLQSCQHQDEAQAFIESQELELYCEHLEWNAEAIRCAAAEGVAPQYKRWA